MNNTGFGIRTGWVQSGTVLLVLDKNGNGTSDQGVFLSDVTINLGAMLFSSNETLDFSQYGSNVYLGNAKASGVPSSAAELFLDASFAISAHYALQNFTTLNLGNGNNKVVLSQAADPYLHTINTGSGNNSISSDNVDVTINFGNGNDTLTHAGAGSVINAGQGQDTFTVSNDILINGSTAQDQILDEAGNVLHGAIGSDNTESQWVRGDDGTRYGINTDGDLVIEDIFGNETFVANYQGGPDVPLNDQTDGIFVGTAQVQIAGLFDLKLPFSEGSPRKRRVIEHLMSPVLLYRYDSGVMM
jgi:hypothetical protein